MHGHGHGRHARGYIMQGYGRHGRGYTMRGALDGVGMVSAVGSDYDE
jgi:hypothetical protein